MNKGLKTYFYNTIIFFLILTGFGQMPIFKRYYIADIPGLGWLAKFYVTFFIHYVAATLLIVFIFYLLTSFYLSKKKIRLTNSGWVRVFGLTGLVSTGILLVIKNFAITPYVPPFIVFLYLCHLTFMMVYCASAVYSRIFKKEYLIS